MKTLIKNAQIVNEGLIFKGHVLIEGEKISHKNKPCNWSNQLRKILYYLKKITAVIQI